MCGGCRVSVGGETKFVCVDGPEFDGHEVDFDLLMSRQRQYLPQEKESLHAYLSKATESKAAASKASAAHRAASNAAACNAGVQAGV
jgi:hypothetical protein